VRDPRGDSIEERVSGDGKRYRIVKNFPTRAEVANVLKGIAIDVRFKEYPEGYWVLRYRTP
jgi:hypothetical protein